MKRLRFIFIILTIVALIGVVAPLALSKISEADKMEDLFTRSLGSVDSILSKNDKSGRFASFKESCSIMSIEELEQECYRSIAINDSTMREVMFCRALINRYDKGMSDTDKTRIIKILNNLGFHYFMTQNPVEAYKILKIAFEMEKRFDKNNLAECALLINMAAIFRSFNDMRSAEKLYSDAFDMVYDKDFNPGTTSMTELLRIHTIIEYLSFLWISDTGESISEPCKTFFRMVPGSSYEYFPFAKYICDAAMAYSANDYIKSAALLDSAFNTLNKNWSEASYRAECKLMKVNAFHKAKVSTEMKKSLCDAERIITSENFIYLLPELKKGIESYNNTFGDSITTYLEEKTAIHDSIFGHSNYIAVRDIRESWDSSVYEIETSNDDRCAVIAIISAVMLGLSVAVIAITTLIIKRRIIIHKNFISPGTINDGEPDSQVDSDQKEHTEPDEDSCADDKEIENKEEEEYPVACDNTESDISDESLHALYEDIRNALESSRNIYNIDFSIESLAEETGISSRRISQVVNVCSGKNFSRLLAEYRVKEACRILKDAKNPVMRPTMDALAEKIGYKSRTHLTRVFKTEIGLTPAEYIATLSSEN